LAGFDQHHKHAAVANTVVARELAGWCWSLAVLHD
jgi:transposase